jgi:hypothetical protein
VTEKEEIKFYEDFAQAFHEKDRDKLANLILTQSENGKHDIIARRTDGYSIAINFKSKNSYPQSSITITLCRPPSAITMPPATIEKFLSYLLSPDRLEEAIGDFEDGYHLMLKRHGVGHARRWYCWQVFMVAARGAFDAAWRAVRIWRGLPK